MLKRVRAALAGLALLFGGVRAAAAAPCAMHDGPLPAPQAGSHAHHGGASKPAPHQHCSCLDHCQSCQSFGVAAAPPKMPELARVVTVAAMPRPIDHHPSRTPHQLPFGTAPPA